MYICNVFAFIITVNTSTQSPCQGIPWISPEEVLCAYTWLQVSWYFLHSTWSTFFLLEKLTYKVHTHVSAAYLQPCNKKMYNQTYDLCMTYGTYGTYYTPEFSPRSLHDSPRCSAPMTSTLLPNAWTCTDPLPGPAADLNWNKAV